MELYEPVLEKDYRKWKDKIANNNLQANRDDAGEDKAIDFDTDSDFEMEAQNNDQAKKFDREMRKYARANKMQTKTEPKSTVFSNSAYYNKLMKEQIKADKKIVTRFEKVLPLVRFTEVEDSYTYYDEIERNFGKQWR